MQYLIMFSTHLFIDLFLFRFPFKNQMPKVSTIDSVFFREIGLMIHNVSECRENISGCIKNDLFSPDFH